MKKKKKKEAKDKKSESVRESSHRPRDGRRKHRHWEVAIVYHDGLTFSRIYTDRERAQRFAERQKKSPVVRTARVREVN